MQLEVGTWQGRLGTRLAIRVPSGRQSRVQKSGGTVRLIASRNQLGRYVLCIYIS